MPGADYQEMIRVAEARQERAAAAFEKYDADKSGEIDESEVLCLLGDLGLLENLQSTPAEFLAAVFAKHDADESGTLSFEEFKGFYNSAVDDIKGRVAGVKGHPTASQVKKAQIAEAKASHKSGKLATAQSAAASSEEVDEISRLLNAKLKPAQQREWFKIFSASAPLPPRLTPPRARRRAHRAAQSTRTSLAGSSSASSRSTCARASPSASVSRERRAPTTGCRRPPPSCRSQSRSPRRRGPAPRPAERRHRVLRRRCGWRLTRATPGVSSRRSSAHS